MGKFWTDGDGKLIVDPITCAIIDCDNCPEIGSSSSSSSSVPLGDTCVDCPEGITPSILKLTVPRVERWEDGALAYLLEAGTYELQQDPIQTCCYRIFFGNGTALAAAINGSSFGAIWLISDNPCGANIIFWKASWQKMLDGPLASCLDISGSLPEYYSFGVEPSIPGPAYLSL